MITLDDDRATRPTGPAEPFAKKATKPAPASRMSSVPTAAICSSA